MKIKIETIILDFLLKLLTAFKSYTMRKARQVVKRFGFNISMTSDYYSLLPTESRVKKNEYRRTKRNSAAGIIYDKIKYKALRKELVSKYSLEFNVPPITRKTKSMGFRLGYYEEGAFGL